MSDEKQHLDLSKVEPVFGGTDPEDMGARETRQGTDGTPAGGMSPETDEAAPPDPDDLDRLRRIGERKKTTEHSKVYTNECTGREHKKVKTYKQERG